MLSRTHAIARRLRALRSDAAMRETEGVFVAEGIHLAIEAVTSGADIDTAVVSGRLLENEEGRDLARRLEAAGVQLHTASQATLDGLQDARSPQPVVLVVRRAAPALDEVLAGRGAPPLVVVACGVQEPGNLGALWRTADAAGATGFIATPGSASLTHPRTVRASMGAIFRLAAAEAEVEELKKRVRSSESRVQSSESRVQSSESRVQGSEFRVIGADARGEKDYDAVDWAGPVALLLGGEGPGLPAGLAAVIDERVRIPMARGVESLSVNAAAAVLLFEAARRRRPVNRAG